MPWYVITTLPTQDLSDYLAENTVSVKFTKVPIYSEHPSNESDAAWASLVPRQ